MAYVVVGNNRGPRGIQGPPGELGFQPALPTGAVSTWYGMSKVGYYRAASQGVVDAIVGRPRGAGPGTILILPIGSTTSTVEWQEFADMGRTWTCTVSSTSAYVSGWRPVQKTKRVGSNLTCGTAPDVRVNANFAHALPLTLGAKAHRWRLHFRNTNDRTSNTISGALTVVGIAIGPMVRDSAGKATGNYVAGAGTVLTTVDGATPSAGSEMFTNWVDNFPLEAGTDYVIRYGFTGASGQTINYLQGGGWELTNGSAAVMSPTTPQVEVKKSPLDVWIEMEVDAGTPYYAYFGDSLTVGQDSTLPVYDSWPAKHARARGAIPAFFAHSGSAFSEWTVPTLIKFRKFLLPNYQNSNGMDTISKPDLLFCSLGSNTVMGQAKTLAETITEMNVTMPLIMDVTSTSVVYTTILPRHDPNDPQEPVRKAYNEYLKDNLPWGGLMVYDAAEALTDPNGSQLNKRWTSSDTNIHLITGGYARFAAMVAT
jgi:hypothetical protein